MTNTLIEFQDHGQDFLWWVVDGNGKVIECGPFQASIWTRMTVTNLAALKPKMLVEYTGDGRDWNIKYPVKMILPIQPVEVAVTTGSFGYQTRALKGKRAASTHSAEVAVQRLADKLFLNRETTIEQLHCVQFARLHSKWRITPLERSAEG